MKALLFEECILNKIQYAQRFRLVVTVWNSNSHDSVLGLC